VREVRRCTRGPGWISLRHTREGFGRSVTGERGSIKSSRLKPRGEFFMRRSVGARSRPCVLRRLWLFWLVPTAYADGRFPTDGFLVLFHNGETTSIATNN
jgi:hypothetical protein